jgi:glycine hydroxymethyltransferase
MGRNKDNPWGILTKKGNPLKMSAVMNSAVFPGMQGGPLEHVIAAKAVAFGEALQPSYREYTGQVINNAQAMATTLMEKGYEIISGGTDNHLMLIDLSNKKITGKDLEERLIQADITVNKNMVPFDKEAPMITSGIRIGTAAMTTRGFKEKDCIQVVDWIDRIVNNRDDIDLIARVKQEVNAYVQDFPLYPDIS